MMAFDMNTKSSRMQFFLYVLLGGIGVTVDFGSYAFLLHLTIPPLFANCVSTILGIGTSYILNSKYTFNEKKLRAHIAAKFFSVGIAGLAASSLLLWVLTNLFSVSPIVSKVSLMPLIAIFQFLLNRKWTFGN